MLGKKRNTIRFGESEKSNKKSNFRFSRQKVGKKLRLRQEEQLVDKNVGTPSALILFPFSRAAAVDLTFQLRPAISTSDSVSRQLVKRSPRQYGNISWTSFLNVHFTFLILAKTLLTCQVYAQLQNQAIPCALNLATSIYQLNKLIKYLRNAGNWT